MNKTFLKFRNRKLSVSYDGPHNSKNTALFFYGGGKTARKERLRPWQDSLASQGIASVAFDYSGCGSSSGMFEDNSLSQRIEEALVCTQWIRDNYPESRICLYGSSMGAYTALGVLNRIPDKVSSLMLVVPAAYSPDAHTVPFGPKFTEILRRDNGWNNSLSFSWIKKFTGTLMIIAGELDDVVPVEIPKLYLRNAVNAKKKNLLILQGMTHTMLGTGNIGKIKKLDDIFTLFTTLIVRT